jgi:hypothetical protein
VHRRDVTAAHAFNARLPVESPLCMHWLNARLPVESPLCMHWLNAWAAFKTRLLRWQGGADHPTVHSRAAARRSRA